MPTVSSQIIHLCSILSTGDVFRGWDNSYLRFLCSTSSWHQSNTQNSRREQHAVNRTILGESKPAVILHELGVDFSRSLYRLNIVIYYDNSSLFSSREKAQRSLFLRIQPDGSADISSMTRCAWWSPPTHLVVQYCTYFALYNRVPTMMTRETCEWQRHRVQTPRLSCYVGVSSIIYQKNYSEPPQNHHVNQRLFPVRVGVVRVVSVTVTVVECASCLHAKQDGLTSFCTHLHQWMNDGQSHDLGPSVLMYLLTGFDNQKPRGKSWTKTALTGRNRGEFFSWEQTEVKIVLL